MSEEIPSFVGVTPFGVYCKICNLSLSIERGIINHGKDMHSKGDFKNAVVVREVHRQIKILREIHANDLTPFLTSRPSRHPTWFCTNCFSVFTKSCNYTRHFEMRTYSSCAGRSGGKMPCYETICGRLAPKSCNLVNAPVSTLTIASEVSTVSMLTDIPPFQASCNKALVVDPDTKVPAPLLTTQDNATKILAPFVRPDEDSRDLSLIYYTLLGPGFEGKMREFLQYSARQAEEDGILYNWLQAGRTWLDNYAAGHISNVSANVRSRLAEFEQKELDGVVVGSRTFSLRRGISVLKGNLDAILRFFYRYPSTIFDDFKSKEVRLSTTEWMIESAIIPKILFTAAAEEPDDHGILPVACLYGLSRGFTCTDNGYDLTMNECGWFASRISALLHLLRAGVCGYLVTLSGSNLSQILSLEEMEIVSRIQNGRVTNLLAPYVKRLRDLNARKPRVKRNTVNANGDITSSGFTFPHAVWSTLIPRVVSIATSCFDEIFQNSLWKLFITKPIRMTDWVRLEASVVDNDIQVWLRDLKLKENIQPLLARLQSVAELCFFGLGVGAVRHEEVTRLTVLSCQWHNSYLYFWSESLKRGSLKASTTPKLVEHRLSLSLSSVLLLIRFATMGSSEAIEKQLLPNHPDASMLGLVQDIFDFDSPPVTLNVRHLFTSIGNLISPENDVLGDDGCFVSTTILTQKSGHTQGTGRRAYGTWLENSDEVLYDRYHGHLGEDMMEPPLVDFTPFSDDILKSSLKQLLGRKAVFRSIDQKRMIDIAANSVVRHAFIGLPCGHGKSLSWMVPTMASYLSGRHVGLRIIIVPYKFLLGHLVHHAVSMLGHLQDKLIVSFLNTSQIKRDSFPAILEGNEMPSILFLNLDSAASLLRFHMTRLQDLAQRKILKRVYLDEFQQLIVEYGFRPLYQCLQELGRIGVPVMCLSGSLPFSMAMSLMSYCGLNPNQECQSVDTVMPDDPIGDGFSFDVVVCKDVTDSIIKFVLESRVGACHVLCSTVWMVQVVATALLSAKLKVLSIIGESPYQTQISCAKSWSKGGYDVLVSTVVGLVGNENKFCKTIVVGGFLFNVSSLVQAIGRLRPSQRGTESKVQIFNFPTRPVDLADHAEKSATLFSEVCEAGCVEESTKDMFMKIFAPVGLHHVLSLRHGCFLQELSGYYGFVRLPCNRCGLCLRDGRSALLNLSPEDTQLVHKDDELLPSQATDITTVSGAVVNPYKKKRAPVNDVDIDSVKKHRPGGSDSVATSQKTSEETSKVARHLCREAKWVFCELLYRCMVCGTAACNGEMCLNACYRCGDRYHKTNVCTFGNTRLAKILANKGVCFGCFDTNQHTMVKHVMVKCPLKRRLKRLMFLDHDRKGSSFDDYLRKLYSSELSFVTMVASYSKDTMLGRYVFCYLTWNLQVYSSHVS